MYERHVYGDYEQTNAVTIVCTSVTQTDSERECSGQTCVRASHKRMGNENVAAYRVYECHVNGLM